MDVCYAICNAYDAFSLLDNTFDSVNINAFTCSKISGGTQK